MNKAKRLLYVCFTVVQRLCIL